MCGLFVVCALIQHLETVYIYFRFTKSHLISECFSIDDKKSSILDHSVSNIIKINMLSMTSLTCRCIYNFVFTYTSHPCRTHFSLLSADFITFLSHIHLLFYIFKFTGKFGDGVNTRKKLFVVIIKYGSW